MSEFAIHPSETSGDGRVIEQSRYIKKTDKLDRIVNCAQCGFPVDLNKRATGDSLGLPDPSTTSETVSPPEPGIEYTSYYGDPVSTGSGCPLCRSMNVTGKYRNKLFGSGKSIEGL